MYIYIYREREYIVQYIVIAAATTITTLTAITVTEL